MKLTQALTLPRIITVVGGGGKTSFIFTLAKETAALGKSVLITTTTAMFNPEYFESTASTSPAQPFDQLFTGPVNSLCNQTCTPGKILVAANDHNPKRKKLIGYSPEDLSSLLDSPQFDLILIEGDGARMRPVKAPADHEPVIPSQTQMVVGCIGLDCLGLPLDDSHVHRPELLAGLAGQAVGNPITDQTLISLAESVQGLFKSAGKTMARTMVLNKADTRQLVEQGTAIGAACLKNAGPDSCLVTSLTDAENPVKQKRPQ